VPENADMYVVVKREGRETVTVKCSKDKGYFPSVFGTTKDTANLFCVDGDWTSVDIQCDCKFFNCRQRVYE
jgi:hypothetical protein